VGLDDERVNTTNRLFVTNEGLAVSEVVGGSRQELGAKNVGYLLSELLVSATTDQH
jgi:hypothetical protein